ncbi:MAG: TAXI family TRAP transporter solute-binding subunit [Myxococcota bacterium]
MFRFEVRAGCNLRYFLLALLGVALLFGSAAFAQRQFVAIGGGSTGGTFNVFASGIGDIIGRSVDGVNMTVEGSAGSAENIRRIQGGDLEMGIAFAGDSYLAYNGTDVFEEGGPYDDLRAIGFLYSAVSQIVTLEDSGITSLADLEGIDMAVGGAGSGTQLSLERLLSTVGIYDTINPVLVAGQNASDQLKNRQVEAYHALFGVPNAAVTDTASTADIHLISSYDEAEAAGFFEQYPFYTEYVIPAGTFDGVDEDVRTFRDAGLWVVSAGVDEDLVYEMTKAIYDQEGLDRMLQVTNVASEMGPDNALVGVQLPLHPGAARYWDEVGVDIPEVAEPR